MGGQQMCSLAPFLQLLLLLLLAAAAVPRSQAGAAPPPDSEAGAAAPGAGPALPRGLVCDYFTFLPSYLCPDSAWAGAPESFPFPFARSPEALHSGFMHTASASTTDSHPSSESQGKPALPLTSAFSPQASTFPFPFPFPFPYYASSPGAGPMEALGEAPGMGGSFFPGQQDQPGMPYVAKNQLVDFLGASLNSADAAAKVDAAAAEAFSLRGRMALGRRGEASL